MGEKHEQCGNTVLNNVEIHDLSSKNYEGIYIDDAKDIGGKTAGLSMSQVRDTKFLIVVTVLPTAKHFWFLKKPISLNALEETVKILVNVHPWKGTK